MKAGTLDDPRVAEIFACLLAEGGGAEDGGAEAHRRTLRESGATQILVLNPAEKTPGACVLGLYNATLMCATPLWYLRHETPEEAAEALDAAGLVPEGWFFPDPRRKHQCRCWNGAQKKLRGLWAIMVNPITYTCPHCQNGGWTDTPVGWSAFLGWALQDPAWVCTAEALVLELTETYLGGKRPVVAWAPVPPEFDLYRNPFSQPFRPLLDVPGTMQLYRDGSIRAAVGDLPPSTDRRLGALYESGALVDRLAADRTELRYRVLVTTTGDPPR